MSTQSIYDAVINVLRKRLPQKSSTRDHLDIGAGRGELIQALRETMSVNSKACDFHIERFELDDAQCVQVDLNHEPIPYSDEQFDFVTCSEVVEHLENYRALLRDAFRVTASGGGIVVTTPNVLNANSRKRYLISGFANLFGPLPVRNDKLYSTGGHITPIPYFYLAHALLDAGFGEIELSIDRVQKTSVFWLILLAPFIFIGKFSFLRKERKKYKTITPENERYVLEHFSWQLLVGRTVVISARKPNKSD